MRMSEGARNEIEEAELIAYHLGELSRWRQGVVRRALERDAALAEESASIAATLRAFRADAATPVVDAAAVLERSWSRVRQSLAVLEPAPRLRVARWRFAAAGFLAAMLLMAGLSVGARHALRVVGPGVAEAGTPGVRVASVQPVISELQAQHAAAGQVSSVERVARRYNNRPGPLTTEPAGEEAMGVAAGRDVAAGQDVAAHLDSAERLLTEVSHAEGPLPEETRSEVHRLLLENALYERTAQARGDHASASVMDDLGRVLMTLDAAPPRTAEGADSLRVEMNVGGVLFDLRILHHNKHSEAE